MVKEEPGGHNTNIKPSDLSKLEHSTMDEKNPIPVLQTTTEETRSQSLLNVSDERQLLNAGKLESLETQREVFQLASDGKIQMSSNIILI